MQPSENEFRTFVGPRANYYVSAWAAAKADVELQRLGWNWPAFFLNIVWLLYRRMYRYFGIGFGVLVAIGIIKGTAEALWHFTTSPSTNLLINFSIAMYFGGFGTWFYYRHAVETINRTKALNSSPEAIAHVGGVRLLWPVVLGTVVAVGVVAGIMVKLSAGGS